MVQYTKGADIMNKAKAQNVEYYDGTKILSLLDLNSQKPEIYIIEGNRTAGKTVYWSARCVKRFIKFGEKFMLLYRFNYELDDVADKFFKDIKNIFFQNMNMESKRRANGIYHELFLDGVSCGYAVSLNSADQIKKNAAMFSDTKRMLFDEFQSETNHYCDNEVAKLLSIHTSVSRGQGEQVRYVPVIMLANSVSLLNPYYIEMGITTRLRDETKFLRGDGYVLERCFIESASKAQLASGFNRAFQNSKYVQYSAQQVYLSDNKAFVEKPFGASKYLATLKYNGSLFAIKEYTDAGIIYCDDKPDITFGLKITVTSDDHQINYVMLKRNDIFLANMRWYFERGCFRFKDLRCKDALLKALSY